MNTPNEDILSLGPGTKQNTTDLKTWPNELEKECKKINQNTLKIHLHIYCIDDQDQLDAPLSNSCIVSHDTPP